ncbi:MAG: hypothetical protein HYX93_06520 [Chloroflexi bacterium]|nr:hypothetical protein [Chloroflexota bacterium]
MALKKRVEVLFEEDKYTYLEHLARKEKTSVGHLIREAVERVYLDTDREKRKEALERFLSEEIDFGGDWEKVKEDLLRGYTEDLEEELGYRLTQ